jgi:Protein of unknown function (DUF1488)
MQAGESSGAASRPRLDGRRVLFEVESAGRSIPCAISLGALQDLSGRRHFRPEELLDLFERSWPQIEAAVRLKLRNRSPASAGLLHIWTDDVEAAVEQNGETPSPG